MKNKLFYGIAIFVIAVVAAVNVNISSQSESLSYNVSLTNVDEALANAENDPEDNIVWDWFEQGFTKDERAEYVVCTVTSGYSINIGFWSYNNQTTYSGHKMTCPDGGYINCTPTSCQ